MGAYQPTSTDCFTTIYVLALLELYINNWIFDSNIFLFSHVLVLINASY